ncbi:MAG: hypothetical protein CL878_10590 [Dehalococcoidia bacterium]|nr:hypothetical protein [Dehalococcoidia bacterium]
MPEFAGARSTRESMTSVTDPKPASEAALAASPRGTTRTGASARGTPSARNNASTDRCEGLGIEAKLWVMADMLGNNMGAAEYKNLVFVLLFRPRTVTGTASGCARTSAGSAERRR